MSDPYLPPPRRPMPDQLQRQITQELTAAAVRRRRGRAVIPLVAAALVATMVAVGVTAFRDQQRVGPAETATAVPATTSPTPTTAPSASATPKPTPKPVTVLDVRPMTRAEIAADRKSCVREEGPGPKTPYQGTPKVQYAMVQRTAGAAGAGSAVRALLLEDQIGHWDCEDGQQMGWSRGARTSVGLTSRVPVAPVTNAIGGSGASCSPDRNVVRSSGTFHVSRAVKAGRVRVVRGNQPGPWLTSEPVQGVVHFLLKLTDPAATERNVRMEFAFLDRDGRTLLVASGFADEPPTSSVTEEFSTCADLQERFPRPKAVGRPRSDAAGIRTCQAMAEELAEDRGVRTQETWKSRLVISTGDEWGAVLSDGRNLVGCSLYPTKEISPLIADLPVVRKSAFSFAVNPIGTTGAQSLWAAGRVPDDVSAISYRLPGNRNVAASIDDGYWMLKHHSGSGRGIGTEEDVTDWPPVVVTVTRASGTQRYTIDFTEETMCRQVSHGC